jgi:hypothetical protein
MPAAADGPGCADAALKRRLLQECLLQRMEPFGRRHTLDSLDVLAFRFYREHQARVDEPAIDRDAASAAIAVVASFLRPGQANDVPEGFKEALTRLRQELDIRVVNVGLDVNLLGHVLVMPL